ncbi:hypothetical protein U1Q18_027810 [Sarracenia purpurea var. burkii]
MEKEACEDVVSEGAMGVGDENNEEEDSEGEHDSEEKNDPEIAEGTDVSALTLTSRKAMVARCDLRAELPIEEVPLLQLHVVLMED